MSRDATKANLRAIGARVLSEANDLKRTPAALAGELGFELAVIDAVIAGQADEKIVQQVLHAMADVYPVALGDLLAAPDDTDEGARLMSADESGSSARIIDRPDRSGARRPYYEYRDTAMSRSAPFRPEWIKQLRHVENAEAANPDVAYNLGHLLHQITFFVGAVNFYWEIDGHKHCAELDSGDSSYITPLIPHSFAARDRNREAIIIAVAYGGAARRAVAELQYLGGEGVVELTGDLRQPSTVFRARLRRHLDAESLSLGQLQDRLVESGLNAASAAALVQEGPRSDEELQALSAALNLRASDLAVHRLLPHEEVVVQRRRDSATHDYPHEGPPAYRLTQLARTKHQPYLKGFDVEVLGGGEGTLRHSLHEYVYNYGTVPVRMEWGTQREALIEPCGSAYVRPFVTHRFSVAPQSASGRLLVVRVPGVLTDDVVTELAGLEPRRRGRAAGESTVWF